MLQKMIDRVIENQIQTQMISCDEKNIYRYGYILVYEVVLNIVLAVVIGIVCHRLGEVLFFLLLYIPLRSFCGGWHADKIWKCSLFSNGILLLEIFSIKYVAQHLSIWLLLLVFAVSAIMIICVAPVETKTKKISRVEHIAYKKIIKVIILVHMGLMIIMTIMGFQYYVVIIAFSYVIQIVMILLEKIAIIYRKSREF